MTSGPANAGRADSAAARPAPNLAGWYPPADPESASVRLGRRPNAPRVRMPLEGGRRSLEALATATIAAGSGAPESLLALCVTKPEFETILWPEMPQSRPATGILPMDAWRTLSNRLTAGCMGAASDLHDGGWELVRVERTGGVMEFRNYRLHRGLALVARNAAGEEQRFGFLRTAVERGGVFKIYSMED